MYGFLSNPQATSGREISTREHALDQIVGLELQKLLVRTRLRGGSWTTLKEQLLSGKCPTEFVAAIRHKFGQTRAPPQQQPRGFAFLNSSGTPILGTAPYSVQRITISAQRHTLEPHAPRANAHAPAT